MDGNITIKGQWASKKNSKRIAGKRIIASANWMAYSDYAVHQLQRMELPCFTGKVREVHLLFFPQDNRRRDLTNGAEGIMDLLVEQGVLRDDSWQVCPRVILESGGIDKANPRVEVTIRQ